MSAAILLTTLLIYPRDSTKAQFKYWNFLEFHVYVHDRKKYLDGSCPTLKQTLEYSSMDIGIWKDTWNDETNKMPRISTDFTYVKVNKTFFHLSGYILKGFLSHINSYWIYICVCVFLSLNTTAPLNFTLKSSVLQVWVPKLCEHYNNILVQMIKV